MIKKCFISHSWQAESCGRSHLEVAVQQRSLAGAWEFIKSTARTSKQMPAIESGAYLTKLNQNRHKENCTRGIQVGDTNRKDIGFPFVSDSS